jgi:hypothetical protein
MIINWKRAIIGLLIVMADIFIYIVLSLMMMSYDDFYDEAKGEYRSWESMTPFDKITDSLLLFWNIVNIAAALYILYRFFNQIKNRHK